MQMVMVGQHQDCRWKAEGNHDECVGECECVKSNNEDDKEREIQIAKSR